MECGTKLEMLKLEDRKYNQKTSLKSYLKSYLLLLKFTLSKSTDSPPKKLPNPHGGLMVSALDSRSSGLGLSPGRGTALCSHSALIHPGV